MAETKVQTAQISGEATLNPWKVGPGTINYDRLVDEFGATRVDAALIKRFEVLHKSAFVPL